MKTKFVNILIHLRNVLFIAAMCTILATIICGLLLSNAEIKMLGMYAIYMLIAGAFIEAIRFILTSVKITIQIKGH